jgi:hypothetical protein
VLDEVNQCLDRARGTFNTRDRDETKVHTHCGLGILNTLCGTFGLAHIEEHHGGVFRAAAIVAGNIQLPVLGRGLMPARGNFVRGVSAAHGSTEGLEIFECHVTCGIAWKCGDISTTVFGCDFGIQSWTCCARAITEANGLLEIIGVRRGEALTGQWVSVILTVVCEPG